MSKLTFRAPLQQMAHSEILEIVPRDTIARIQQTDAHPLFKAFSVGHEGTAQGANLIGHGSKFIRWAKNVVVQMFNRIGNGLKAFKGHAKDTNSHAGRQEVGELVGKTMKEINGVLHTVGVLYIKPEYRDQKLDVASLEGEVEFGQSDDGNIDVLDVVSITGVALEDGDVTRPAMPGATLQGALQMFTQNTGRYQQMSLTKDEVKKAVIDLNLKPGDIFSDDHILSLDVVKKNKQDEYEHAKRVEEQLGKAREENSKLQGDITKLNGEMTKLQKQVNSGMASTVLSKIGEAEKYDPKFLKFVEKNLKGFKSDKKDSDFEKDLKDFVKGQEKEYEEAGKEFGFDAKIKAEDKDGDKGGDKGDKGKGKGTPPADGQQSDDDDQEATSEYTDPEKNDFIA